MWASSLQWFHDHTSITDYIDNDHQYRRNFPVISFPRADPVETVQASPMLLLESLDERSAPTARGRLHPCALLHPQTHYKGLPCEHHGQLLLAGTNHNESSTRSVRSVSPCVPREQKMHLNNQCQLIHLFLSCSHTQLFWKHLTVWLN